MARGQKSSPAPKKEGKALARSSPGASRVRGKSLRNANSNEDQEKISATTRTDLTKIAILKERNRARLTTNGVRTVTSPESEKSPISQDGKTPRRVKAIMLELDVDDSSSSDGKPLNRKTLLRKNHKAGYGNPYKRTKFQEELNEKNESKGTSVDWLEANIDAPFKIVMDSFQEQYLSLAWVTAQKIIYGPLRDVLRWVDLVKVQEQEWASWAVAAYVLAKISLTVVDDIKHPLFYNACTMCPRDTFLGFLNRVEILLDALVGHETGIDVTNAIAAMALARRRFALTATLRASFDNVWREMLEAAMVDSSGMERGRQIAWMIWRIFYEEALSSGIGAEVILASQVTVIKNVLGFITWEEATMSKGPVLTTPMPSMVGQENETVAPSFVDPSGATTTTSLSIQQNHAIRFVVPTHSLHHRAQSAIPETTRDIDPDVTQEDGEAAQALMTQEVQARIPELIQDTIHAIPEPLPVAQPVIPTMPRNSHSGHPSTKLTPSRIFARSLLAINQDLQAKVNPQINDLFRRFYVDEKGTLNASIESENELKEHFVRTTLSHPLAFDDRKPLKYRCALGKYFRNLPKDKAVFWINQAIARYSDQIFSSETRQFLQRRSGDNPIEHIEALVESMVINFASQSPAGVSDHGATVAIYSLFFDAILASQANADQDLALRLAKEEVLHRGLFALAAHIVSEFVSIPRYPQIMDVCKISALDLFKACHVTLNALHNLMPAILQEVTTKVMVDIAQIRGWAETERKLNAKSAGSNSSDGFFLHYALAEAQDIMLDVASELGMLSTPNGRLTMTSACRMLPGVLQKNMLMTNCNIHAVVLCSLYASGVYHGYFDATFAELIRAALVVAGDDGDVIRTRVEKIKIDHSGSIEANVVQYYNQVFLLHAKKTIDDACEFSPALPISDSSSSDVRVAGEAANGELHSIPLDIEESQVKDASHIRVVRLNHPTKAARFRPQSKLLFGLADKATVLAFD